MLGLGKEEREKQKAQGKGIREKQKAQGKGISGRSHFVLVIETLRECDHI